MKSYQGRFAELYDLFYKVKPYNAEVQFIDNCLKSYCNKPTHKILELACGTGNHTLEFLKIGYDLTAIDYSVDMLNIARHKVAHAGYDVKFYNQNMCELDVEDRLFDAVICLFDSIGFVQTNKAVRNVLQGVRTHLISEGLFIFDFWHAAAMLKYYEPIRIKKIATNVSEILRISETDINYDKQLAIVNYSILELYKDGTYNAFKETQTNRFFMLQEIEDFLSTEGFNLIQSFNGYSDDNNIDDQAWHIVVIAGLK